MAYCRGFISIRLVLCPVFAAILIAPSFVFSQEISKTASATVVAPEQPDIVTHETTTFKVRVNNVLMRVVVTDAHGNAVGNLTKDNFEILDNGKPQRIVSFSVQEGAAVAASEPTQPASVSPSNPERPIREIAAPQQYYAYLLDDVHIGIEDLMAVRNAARKHMMKLKPSDRAALFTTSGRASLGFSSDGTALMAALDKIQALKESEFVRNRCPWMNYYTADQILNKQNGQALKAVMAISGECVPRAHGESEQEYLRKLEEIVRQAAEREITKGDAETKMALSVLRDVVRELATRPGQRTLVLVSPGFLAQEEHYFDVSQDLDAALRANVVINSLDARGLWTEELSDASLPPESDKFITSPYGVYLESYLHASARDEGNVLGELAYGTGGTWFHDNNDLLEGFRRTATSPEVVYLIAFTPQNLKNDGKFHKLKLVLKNAPNLSARTRKGYFAPKAAENATEQARSDIEDMVFSRDERQEIPLDLHTEFYRSHDKANVAVVTHVDLRPLSFRKEAGRNLNTVTVVSVLFDQDGHYVTGFEKKVEFHMRDEMLQRQMRTGIAVKSNFTVAPGGYLVRVVVRDAEGEMMSAKNDTVRIPYN